MLDGIPLAIELTASRTRVLTVDQVAARLQSGAASALDPSRMVDVPARQVSLRSIVESTIEALSESASVLLDWLAAMDGWTSLELLEAVAGAESGEKPASRTSSALSRTSSTPDSSTHTATDASAFTPPSGTT